MDNVFTPFGIQKDIFDWFTINFTKDNEGNEIDKETLVAQQITGMIEEIGELSHSILKLQQGIRKNENHLLLLEDSIGDIIIFSCNLLSLLDISLNDIKIREDKIIKDSILVPLDLNLSMSNLIEAIFDYDTAEIQNEIEFHMINYCNDMIMFSMSAIYETLEALTNYYELNKGTFTILVETAEKVLKRDWNKHRQDNTEVN
jgi:NTP pyrophosphatase (non-canonical NTP hydrolase)